MARITVIGGTGYAGGGIVAEAARRGHDVTSISRARPETSRAGVTDVTADLRDEAAVVAALDGADVVVFAAAPRGDMAGRTATAILAVTAALPPHVRVGVIGGAGGALTAPGGPRVVDGDFDEQYRDEALEMASLVPAFEATGTAHDWFIVHPADVFGPWAAGERTGVYRTGGRVTVKDAAGRSFISGADFAIAVLDEIERPAHVGANFTVGY